MNRMQFQELYKGFKRSLSRDTILEFIKKRILAPNDIQYLECGNTLDIIDLKDKRAYIFIHLEFRNLEEYSNQGLIRELMENIRKILKNNRVFGISKNKNTIFVVGKNAMFYVYFDKRLHRHNIRYFINKKGKYKLDEFSFANFLTELAKMRIIKADSTYKIK